MATLPNRNNTAPPPQGASAPVASASQQGVPGQQASRGSTGFGGGTQTSATTGGPLASMWGGATSMGPMGAGTGQGAWRAPGSAAPAGASTTGANSGPTTVEDWFQKRASSTDPGWEYATGRAQDQINNQYAARGGYNSSGATQSLSDMYANATSQRESQLDSLANEATSAHQNALNEMFNVQGGLAGGQAGTAAGYDTASGSAQSQGLQNDLNLALNKSTIDQTNNQAKLDYETNIAKTLVGATSGAKGK